MSHDVYLILIGAGISLASSVITILIQFVLNLMKDRAKDKRDLERKKSQEIRQSLLDKSFSHMGDILGENKPMQKQMKTIPWIVIFIIGWPTLFLIQLGGTVLKWLNNLKFQSRPRIFIPAVVGIIVFSGWLIWVFVR